MFKNYWIYAFRSTAKNKIASSIHVLGLALGLTSCVLLLSYVGFELSYDKFHENASRIYRVQLDSYNENELEYSGAVSYYAESPALKERFPEVVNYVRLHRADGMVNYYPPNGTEISHFEQNGLYADSSFFSVFSFPLIKGERKSVLRNASSVLVSESIAKKYFGDEDPIGKTIHLSTGWAGGAYVVEGIFKDVPRNSHFYFDFLFSIQRLLVNDQFKNGGWYWQNFYNYLVFRQGIDPKRLESTISSFLASKIESVQVSDGTTQRFVLQPLTDIHLHSNITYELDTNGNYQFVYFMLVVALVIMAIVWLNYVNLSTAKAMDRAKEMGVQKIMGAQKGHLVMRYLVESFLICVLAIVLAGIFLTVLSPIKSSFFEAPYFAGDKLYWIIATGVFLFGTLVSALYPAFTVASYSPLSAIKGGQTGQDRAMLRKIFVVVQFAIAIVLIIATFGIGKQLLFLRSGDQGMKLEHKLIVRAPRVVQGSYLNNIDLLKANLKELSSVVGVASSSEVPGKEIFWSAAFKLAQRPESDFRDMKVLTVDEDFIPVYGHQLIAGRNFNGSNAADFGATAIVNETAVRLLGLNDVESAIDQKIETNVGLRRVVGVIKDFQQESLKKSNSPIVLQFIPWHNDFLTVSLKSGNVRSDVALVTDVFRKVFPGNAVDYFFLDDYFERQYKADEQFWRLFRIFSTLAIFIACIGLFGLSSYMISKRTREIAIRKVLGISELGVIVLVSRDFIKLVLLAFVISVPIASWLMNRWLEDFSHRTSIPMSIYLVAGILAIVVAFLTIGFQAARAAFANPAKAIGRE